MMPNMMENPVKRDVFALCSRICELLKCKLKLNDVCNKVFIMCLAAIDCSISMFVVGCFALQNLFTFFYPLLVIFALFTLENLNWHYLDFK